MATQDKNLIVYNGGELQKVGATDKLNIYAADFSDNVAIAGTLGVTGASTLAGLSATNGSFSGTLGVTGAATLSSTLGVTGATTLAALTAGSSTLASASITNNATVGGTLGVTGASTFTGDIGGGNATLTGTLAAGASTLASLGVTNNATVGGTLGVTGASTLASASITNNATVGGTLGVTGATTLSSTLSAGASTLSSASITNNATVGGTLGVTGATTLSDTLSAGASTLASASVTGNASVGGTLGVTGATTLSSTLGVTGATTLSDTLSAGASTLASASVTGNATVGGTLGVTGATTLSSTLGVTGAATLSSSLGVTGAITGSDSITITNGGSFGSVSTVGTLNAGASTLGNTMVGTLGASGAATLSSTLGVTGATTLSSTLGVTGAATLSSTLGVTGATTLSSTLGVTGATTLSDTLGVTGATTLSDTLGVSGAATFSDTIAVTGAATFSDTIAVTGAASFSGDLLVGGDLTVDGSIISRGQQDVVIRDAFLDLAFGDYSGAVTSGGFTVSMNKAVGFTAEDVTDFTAKAGATLATFTVEGGSTAFVAGDIVAITAAGDTENNGLFAVESVASGVVTVKGNLAGLSAPFLQNDFVAASGQSAKAYKVDLAAVAMADGVNFPQAGGAAWPKGTFITAYFNAATVSNTVTAGVPQGFAANGAWQSVGQVDLQEAYNTGNTIALADTKNLVVTKPGSGSAAIQYTSNANSFYRTANANLALGVWDAAATNVKSAIAFAPNATTPADFDIAVSSGAIFSVSAKDVSSLSKGGLLSLKVQDGASSDKGELSIAQTGAVTLKSYTNNVNIDAGNTNVVAIASDTMFKADFAGVAFASLGYKVGVAASLAAKKVVAANGAAASPTVPNVMGVSLAAESSGVANVCTMHGSLVQVLPAPGASFSVGAVAYLAANGEISHQPPSTSGSYVMRVGYIVNLPAGSEPVVQFAPQFIAKVL